MHIDELIDEMQCSASTTGEAARLLRLAIEKLLDEEYRGQDWGRDKV